MGENHFDNLPVAVYAVNLLGCAVTYFILQEVIIADSTLSNRVVEALEKQKKKGMISLFMYIAAIPCAFFYPVISAIMFALVSIM